MNPKLTILLPVIEINQLLSLAIDSLKNQTFTNFECFILTRKLNEIEIQKLSSYISLDLRFTIHELQLGGITFALNYGLNITKSKYLARMDGDDISHPLRLEKQINFLDDNQEYAVVGCRVKLIDKEGKLLKQTFKFFEDDQEIRKALKYRMPLCHPAILFRTEILMENKGYLYGNTAEDHELFIRIARNPKYKFINLQECLFSYRRHEDQLTNIKFARKAYCNISGFMFTEFMLTYNLSYLIGIFAYHPFLRKIRQFYKNK
jgi:glycosyltransferase involved in cell wall biosynthesis